MQKQDQLQMTPQEKIDQYLREASQHILTVDTPPTDLLALIEERRKEFIGQPAYEEFFSGEYAFYNDHYEKALKHYLQATLVCNFHFFCYRASAYLFYNLGNSEKALSFTQKALKLYPDDTMCTRLQHRLLTENLSSEKEPFQPALPLPLGENEIYELAQIFEKQSEDELGLFAKEFSSTAHAPANVAGQFNQTNPVIPMEIPMNTESDIFSSPKSEDSGATQALTQRLYSNPTSKERDPYTKQGKMGNQAFDDLRKLAMGSSELGSELAGAQGLEQRIKTFQLTQAELTRHYLEQAKSRTPLPDNCLHYLNGWVNRHTHPTPYNPSLYLTEQSRKTAGGIFIRWNGKGIAINPGERFLENFHEQGLHIRDIDAVIVTSDLPETYADVKQIYDLCYQLNKVSSELQIIHYYFNYSAYQDLSRILKPHFKQERDTLHSLEMFVDSPDVEKIDLADGIILHYFSASSGDTFATNRGTKEDFADLDHTALGIRLELKSHTMHTQDKVSVRIGYISHAAWNPLMAHHLGSCDLLITGFGNTTSNDINKMSYNTDCLGYYGTYTLLEEVAPRLLLCGEFGGREGDLRIEAAQKMRQDYTATSARSMRNAPVVLPADTGLFVNLKTLQIQCSVSNTWIEASQVRTTKTTNAFGKLEYLSPSCWY